MGDAGPQGRGGDGWENPSRAPSSLGGWCGERTVRSRKDPGRVCGGWMLRGVLSVVLAEKTKQWHVMLRILGCKAAGRRLLWSPAFEYTVRAVALR